MKLWSLRSKLQASIIMLLVLMAAGILFFFSSYVRTTLRGQLQAKGIFMARHLANEAVNPILLEDSITVMQFLKEYVQDAPDVAYLYIQDAQGIVLAHTFKGGFPHDLLVQAPMDQSLTSWVQPIYTEEGRILDIAVPLKDTAIGLLHMGVEEAGIQRLLNKYLTGFMLILASVMVVGMLLASLLSRVLTRPLSQLIPLARAVGEGNLEGRFTSRVSDEVGELGQAFNTMIEDLHGSKVQLKSSMEYTESILHCMSEALFTLSPDGVVQTVNQAACQIMGYSSDELRGRGGAAFLMEQELHLVLGILDKDPPADRVTNHECSLVRKGGGEVPVILSCSVIREQQGSAMGVVGVARDITCLRATEKALLKSEKLYRSLFEDSPMPLMELDLSGPKQFLDGLDGDNVTTSEDDHGEDILDEVMSRIEMVHANQSARDLYDVSGIDKFEMALQGNLWRESRRMVPEIITALARGESLVQGDAIHHTSNGQTIHVHLRCSVAPGNSANLSRVLVSVSDCTNQKKMEASLARTDRMASVGLLAAGVAHEINNPLTYILFNLQMLQDDLPALISSYQMCRGVALKQLGRGRAGRFLDSLPFEGNPEELGEFMADANDGARRVRGIVRDLKAFSNTSDERMTQVNVNDVVESAINMAFNAIKYRAKLVKVLDDVPLIRANEGRISQVFLNLLVNAAHAIPEGNMEGNEIRVISRAVGGEVQVEVQDTGSGIALEHLGRLFEPFFSTKQAGVGSGLGLSICQSIVEGLGGRIEVTSELGQGTQFMVHLPLGEGDEDLDPALRASNKQAPEVKRHRVLVVDDEAAIGSSLKRVLRKSCEVVVACSGEEGRDLLLEAGASFDMVLCDLMMPGMSGMELHQWVTRNRPAMLNRMVFMSGGTFTAAATRFREEVVNTFLEKPIGMNELKAVIAEQIANS